jgi:ATP-dependent Clp protease adaptor protein ClpS
MVENVTRVTVDVGPTAVWSGGSETVLPEVEKEQQTESKDELESGYLVICWNDPVNLMDYVTHVFRVVFGWSKSKAERHMLQVHRQGKSVLTRESMERAEHYVHQLQKYGLQATMERD